MAPLSIKIVADDGAVTKTFLFDTSTKVEEAHRLVREKILTLDPEKEYGFFLEAADGEYSGVWLESGRALDYYMLRDGDYLHYLPRYRNLRLRMLDDTVKTLHVDESKKIGELMFYICSKIGVSNHEEYGLCDVNETAEEESKASTGTLTLKRRAKEKDAELQQLIKKFKADNNVEWLDQHKTLRELRVDPKKTLLFKRRLFYSDRNVDSRDPLQLNLLYVQTRDAILEGAQVVTEEKAIEFAGLQCQIQYGDFQEDKHKPGFIENLNEFLSPTYASSWGVEKKVFREHRRHTGLSPIEAKHLYIKMARELPTYGVTFFVVKEKQKGKKKLVPRLLGITSESILRLDEETKEILQTWQLTQVKSYRAGGESFTLNFGDYSDKEYSVKTNEGGRIKDILEGYIDIIRKRLEGPCNVSYDTGEVIMEENVSSSRGSVMYNHTAQKVETHSHVGPSQIIAMEQGQNVSQGTNVTTVQQIVMSRRMDQTQHGINAIKGDFSSASQFSQDFGKKLNYLNSESVKAVVLLSDPTSENIQQVRDISQNLEDALPDIIIGVKEKAAQMDEAEAKKHLDSLDELCAFINTLSSTSKHGDLNDPDKLITAQNAAKKIADLSTQIYFSLDPKTKRRSKLILESRKSFIADEKISASLRRASFLTATNGANQAVEAAQEEIYEAYEGPALDKEDILRLENDAIDKMGKLNAAVAQLLVAHADPKNVDYEMAVNSMNAIQNYVPRLAQDAKLLSSVEDGVDRSALLDRINELLEQTKNICMLTGTADPNIMQDAGTKYADTSKKLLFIFGRGKPLSPNMENEDKKMKGLVMDVGNKTSELLLKVNELSQVALNDPCCEQLDKTAVDCADAVHALLACAKLTLPIIQEAHCQSALAAAIENLSSSAQSMSSSWKPLVEKPGHHVFGIQLSERSLELAKALEKLKNSFSNYGDTKEEQEKEPLDKKAKKRLRFVTTLSSAKGAIDDANKDLENLKQNINQAPGSAPNLDVKETRRRLADKLAQLNAAIASLLQATADPQNQNMNRAQRSLDTICKLTPNIVNEAASLHGSVDPNTWDVINADLRSMFEAVKDMCDNATENDGKALKENISKYAKASTNLTHTCSPRPDAKKQNAREVLELARSACQETSGMLANVYQLAEGVGGEEGQALEQAGAKVVDAAQALLRTAEVTSPSMNDSRCQASIISAVENQSELSKELEKIWVEIVRDPKYSKLKENLQRDSERLQDILNHIKKLCHMGIGHAQNYPYKLQYFISDEDERQQFIASLESAKETFSVASDDLTNTKIKRQGFGPKIDVQETQRGLADRLAQLNAAIASLMQATSDRDKINTHQAESAVQDIRELTPGIVKAVKSLNGNINGEAWSEMSEELKNMLGAARSICDDATDSNTEDINDLLSRFANSSGKLIHVFNPDVSKEKQKQILELSHLSCAQSSLLLSKVYHLAEEVGGEEGQVLDQAGERIADAAQKLLTTAQITMPSLDNIKCQAAFASAVNKHKFEVKNLESKWKEIVQNPEYIHYKDDLQHRTQRLEDTIDELQNLAQVNTGLPQSHLSEKQRLKFVTNLSSAKNAIEDASKDLGDASKQKNSNSAPAINVRQTKRCLADKLSQLNAAIASLMQATADRHNPDVALAETATETICKVSPEIVEAINNLNGNMDEADRKTINEDIKSMLEAAKEICDYATNDEVDIQDVASKFANSSGKLMFTFNPRVKARKEKQILDQSRSACEQTSVMLLKVNQLAESVGGEQGQQLDAVGAQVVDDAQTLLTTATITAQSIDDPRCKTSLMSAVNRQSASMKDLDKTLKPVVDIPQYQHYKDDLLKDSKGVQDTLDKLRGICETDASPVRDNLLNLQQSLIGNEKQRLKFITTLSSAKKAVEGASKDLENIKRQGPGIAPKINAREAQKRLAEKFAQLNAAIASLIQATADAGKPDVQQAESAIEAIRALAPDIIKDAKSVNGNVDNATWKAIEENLKPLLEATLDICGSSDENKTANVHDALSKFAIASSNLTHALEPTVNIDKEKQVLDLSKAACQQTSDMLLKVYELAENVGEEEGHALDLAGAKVVDGAQALLTTAEITAPSIGNAQCQSALVSAVDCQTALAKELEDTWKPIVQKTQYHQYEDNLQRGSHAVQNTLGILRELCQVSEAEHLKLNKNLLSAKKAIEDANKTLEDVRKRKNSNSAPAINERQTKKCLADKLSQMNAAIASLMQATADRHNPDVALAETATETICKVSPEIVEAINNLNGNMDEADRKTINEDIKSMLEAAKEICDYATNDEVDIQDVASKFANSSGKLMFTFNPRVKARKEKQILDQSQSACEQTSVMLLKVNQLAESVGGEQGQQLDAVGAQVVDDAQTLLTTATITAQSIDDPRCKTSLMSAVNRQSASMKDLDKTLKPVVDIPQYQHYKDDLLKDSKGVQDTLDKLRGICETDASPVRDNLLNLQQSLIGNEKQRLKFITTLSSAKKAVEGASKDLENIKRQGPGIAPKINAREAQKRLAEKLAQLNAAIASLIQATSDAEKPDVQQAESAIEAIRALAPDIIKDAKSVNGNVDNATWKAIEEDLKPLLEATLDICESSDENKTANVHDALSKFAIASSNLTHALEPTVNIDKEKQVLDLSKAACQQTSDMLLKVYELAENVGEEEGHALDLAGAKVVDGAQALLTTAEITAPSIGNAQCQSALVSAVDCQTALAKELEDTWKPIVQKTQYHQYEDNLQRGSHAVQSTLGILRELCQESKAEHLKLKKNLLSAKKTVEDASKTLEDVRKQDHDVAPKINVRETQRNLADKLAQLNAVIASLIQATSDRQNPDMELADRAIGSINELAPAVVNDVKLLKGNMYDKTWTAVTENLKCLLEATSDICDNPENKDMNETVVKLGKSSLKLMVVLSPRNDVKKEKEVLDLSKSACEVTSAMLGKVYHLAEDVGGEEGQLLDQTGAKVVDSAQALLSITKITSPVLRNAQCQASLISAADNHSSLTKELESTWKSIVLKPKYRKHRADLEKDSQLVQATLDKLREMCRIDSSQRLSQQLNDCLIWDAKENLSQTEKLLDEKIKLASTKSKSNIQLVAMDDPSTVPQRLLLAQKLAKLNNAIAQIVQAISDRENQDHETAYKALVVVSQLIPEIVKDGIILDSTVESDGRMMEEARELCKASTAVCDCVVENDVEGINKAATEYANHATKLRYILSPKKDPTQNNQILESAKSVCERTSLMLSRVSRLAELVDASRAEELDERGAAVGDTAQALLTTAQITGSSVKDDGCKSSLIASADKLLTSSLDLKKTWQPLVQNEICHPIGEQLHKDQDMIQVGVNKLKSVCEVIDEEDIFKKPAPKEKLIIEDCPLKQMAKKILLTAQAKSKSSSVPPQEQKLLVDFCKNLEGALKALDVANARCRNAPMDAQRRAELEAVAMNVQQMCLFSKDLGSQESYIVDLANYINYVTSSAEDVIKATYNVTPTSDYVMNAKRESQQIIKDAVNLFNTFSADPSGVTDDILTYDHFAQGCEDRLNAITEALHDIPDSKSKIELQEKVQVLKENIDLLRFATKSNLSTAMGVSFDMTLENLADIEDHIDDIVKPAPGLPTQDAETVKRCLINAQEALVSSLVSSENIPKAFAEYALHMRGAVKPDKNYNLKLKDHLKRLADLLKCQVAVRGRMVSTWQEVDGPQTTAVTDKIIQELDSFNENEADIKPDASLAASNEYKNLLMPRNIKMAGDNKSLEDKFHKLVHKLTCDVKTMVLSCHQPESLARCLNMVSETASQVATTAKSIKTDNVMASKQIDDASQHMCKATYRLLKVSQSIQRTPNDSDGRRRLQDACKSLNDSINKLVRIVLPGNSHEGEEMSRHQWMQEAFLQAGIPCSSLGYSDCLDAIQSQQDVIQKLSSGESMTKAERTESLGYVTSAIYNATEYAAQTAYLLSLSKSSRNVVEHGLVDVSRLKKTMETLRGDCLSLLYCGDAEQIKHLKSEISKQTEVLQQSLDDEDDSKIQANTKATLHKDMQLLRSAVTKLNNTHSDQKDGIGKKISAVCGVVDAINKINSSIDKIEEPQHENDPRVQASSKEIMDNTKDLIKKLSSLSDKAAASDDDGMTWVMFGGNDVVKTFEKLVDCIRQKGIDAEIIASTKVQEEEVPVKSHMQIQLDLGKKWLQNPASKPEVKEAAIRGIQYTIDLANKVTEELPDAEKEDMKQVVTETKQLLADCTQKYNSDKASLLMERLKELKKMLERGVVTRVVEDFLQEEPMIDVEHIVAKEQDNSKRKYILERKIAELLAQLGKVTMTGRLVADTGSGQARKDLINTSNQVELLAPNLVRAAQKRLETPDDKQAIEEYMALLEQYAKAIASMRELCDRAVDPIDFAQAAGETMHRIREENSVHNDPQTCSKTSSMILRLGQRVVDVGMNSDQVKKDPEMKTTLTNIRESIQNQSGGQAPDWKAIFAEILQKTSQVEAVLGGENIFNRQPEPDQPIYAAALDLHAAVREWSARDNDIVANAKRMAVLMAKLSHNMDTGNKRELLITSKAIVAGAAEVAALARKMALECTDMRIRTNLLQVCDKIPTISGQLKILTTVKGSSLGHQGSTEDQEAMNMLVCNAQNLMTSIQEVVKAAASASVKIMSQRGPRMKWVRRRNYY